MEKRNRGHRMIRLRFIAGSPAHFSSVFVNVTQKQAEIQENYGRRQSLWLLI